MQNTMRILNAVLTSCSICFANILNAFPFTFSDMPGNTVYKLDFFQARGVAQMVLTPALQVQGPKFKP
jgi:hypothetical protein